MRRPIAHLICLPLLGCGANVMPDPGEPQGHETEDGSATTTDGPGSLTSTDSSAGRPTESTSTSDEPVTSSSGQTTTGSPGDDFSEPVLIEIDDPSPDTQFDVPEGALGFDIALFNGSGGTLFGIEGLQSPAGEPAITDYVPVGGSGPASRSDGSIATTAVPQGFFDGNAPTIPGTWTADFVVTEPGARALVQIQRTEDGDFHGGVLDLHVHVAEGLVIGNPTEPHEVSSESAAEDPAIQARLTEFEGALEELFELELGEVQFHSLPAQYLHLDNDSETSDAIEQTGSVTPGQALHVLLVQTLLDDPETPVWGLSPGLPGVPIQTGTQGSALVLALTTVHSPRADALTLLHEFGHFVGLHHTTEIGGGFYDPIGDTPRCVDILSVPLAACPDAHNLMFAAFYQATGGIDIEVTPAQRQVLQGSPVYRAYAR